MVAPREQPGNAYGPGVPHIARTLIMWSTPVMFFSLLRIRHLPIAVSSMVCTLTSTLCTAQATQLSHTRYWYDLRGCSPHTNFGFRGQLSWLAYLSWSKSRAQKKNNPRPITPPPQPPARMGRLFSPCRHTSFHSPECGALPVQICTTKPISC